MDKKTQVQAWRSKSFRDTVGSDAKHPAGIVDLQDEALKSITGGCFGPSTIAWSCMPDGYMCP